MELTSKKYKENRIVEMMIKIYCREKHRYRHELCNDCQEILDYAILRNDKCPNLDTKSFCSVCKTHCYSTEMRVRMKLIMKYSGRRMLLYHPLLAIKYLWITLLNKLFHDKDEKI